MKEIKDMKDGFYTMEKIMTDWKHKIKNICGHTVNMEIKERSNVTRSTFCGSSVRYLKFVRSITLTQSCVRIFSAT